MGLLGVLVLLNGQPLHQYAQRYKIEASYVVVPLVMHLRQPHELRKRKVVQLMYL